MGASQVQTTPAAEAPPSVQRPSYALSRDLFLRLMGVVYLCAFGSMWVQVRGLFGSRGVLPIAEFLQSAYDQLGADAYWRLPTLFWFDSSDRALVAACAIGAVLSCLLILGIAPLLMLALLWALYLSIVSAGQDFLGFQWDWLLLEAGFLALFFAPLRLRLRLRRPTEPSPAIRWLILWLLFRLTFSAGIVKLLSGDPTWRNLTAMSYHYETQPIPSWTSWYVHQLPPAFHSAEVLFMFSVELLVPFFIFAPRLLRHAAFVVLTVLQLLIMATGNFGFFNVLTITLAVPMLDDGFFPRWLRDFSNGRARLPPSRSSSDENAGSAGASPSQGHDRVDDEPPARSRRSSRALIAVAIVLGLLSLVPFASTLGMINLIPSPLLRLYVRTQPFGLTSPYGLFAVMTTQRPEIIIEGSDDGVTWKPYEFKYKPGDVNRPPPIIGPHMPRLDWQMWFAALGHYETNPWLRQLLDRLLEGSPDVLRLLAHNPFPNAPPRHVRARMYDYHFTDTKTRRATGAWWRRTELGEYAPIRQRDRGLESFDAPPSVR